MTLELPLHLGSDGRAKRLLVGADYLHPQASMLAVGTVRNFNFAASVGANILTISPIGDDGFSISSSNCALAKFRSSTANQTLPVVRTISSAPSSLLTVVGASLGARSGTLPFRYWVLLFDNAGAPYFSLINCVKLNAGGYVTDIESIFPDRLMSTVPISAGSTSAGVAYSNPASLAIVTVSNASPAVVTWNSHGLAAGTPVIFQTTGALPSGLAVNTTYYVISAGLTANSFRVSAELGGAAMVTSSAGSGTHTCNAGLYRKAFAVLGWIGWDGLSAAGTFASAPTEAAPWMPGIPLPGQVVRRHVEPTNATGSTTSAVPNDATRMQISEGAQWASFDYYPISKANVRRLWASGFGGANPANHVYTGLFEAGSNNAISSGWSAQDALVKTGATAPETLFDVAGTKQTYSLRIGPAASGTFYQNDYAGGGFQAGGMWTFLNLEEVQG